MDDSVVVRAKRPVRVIATDRTLLIDITLYDEPIPQPRPRATVQNGHARVYQPSHATRAQWRLRQAIIAALPADYARVMGPVAVWIEVWLPMPKSVPKSKRTTAQPMGARNDLDNFVKLILDSAAPLWFSDGQVVELHAEKFYSVNEAGEDTPPRWKLRAEALA